MKQKTRTWIYKYLPVFIILIFSTSQFILILRHKSAYVSDSYFYKHIFYQLKGDSFSEARNKIVSQVDLTKSDQIEKNIFLNPVSYSNSYEFFKKRPVYPLIAYVFNFFMHEYISFLLPVFLSYIGILILSYFFLRQSLNPFLAVIGTGLFASFYPFLDWSTYLLTDTIAAFFWFLEILFAFKLLTEKNIKWLIFFGVTLCISLFTREQSVLMLPIFMILSIILIILKRPKSVTRNSTLLFIVSLFLTVNFFAVSHITKQKTIVDTIIYTQNDYGLKNYTYTKSQTLAFMKNRITSSHASFARELVSHHWWFLFFVLAIFGALKTLLSFKKASILDMLIILSALASYSAIFIYPVLSYRYFYPVVLAVVYFFLKLVFIFYSKKLI